MAGEAGHTSNKNIIPGAAEPPPNPHQDVICYNGPV